MKVGNKLLNRVVAVGMMAVVLFCAFSLPKPELARASTNSDTFNNWFSGGSYHYEGALSGNMSSKRVEWKCEGADPIYFTVFLYDGTFNSGDFYSKSDFKCHYDIYEGDKLLYGYDVSVYANTCKMFGRIYNCSINQDFLAPGMHRSVVDINKYEAWRDSGTVEYCKNESIMVHLEASTVYGGWSKVGEDSGWMSLEGDDLPGGSTNPIKKADFGYPDIYNSTYIHNDPNNLETLDKLYSGQDFQWKKKTTTGFDLTNNDYNYTYIECKVKANYQYNDKFSGKGSWHDFASYGEMGNLGKVRAEILSHYYTFQEFQEALPKTSNELPDHKMRAIKSSAVYYFRVVCMKTSSTVVIPDEKDCKYYAGPWRSVNVGKINGKDGDSIIEDGDFDENGEWKKDDDSTDNGKDIDNGSAEGDDLNDASDKAHETINSNANKSTLDLDSAKAFINQVADVPKMIADIFSFLPDWVKYSFAFGFALIPILIIFKLIRG